MIIKKLIGQTATYGLFTIVSRFISFLVTPYLTQVLTESEFGVTNYYYGLFPLGIAILTAGMETGFFRFIGKCGNEAEKRRVYSTVLTFVMVASGVFFVFAALFTHGIYDWLKQYEVGAESLIPIAAAVMALDSVQAILYARLRAESKVRRFITAKMVNVLSYAVLCVFFYSLLPLLKDSVWFRWMWLEGYGGGYAVLATLLASIASAAMLLPQIRNVTWKIDRPLLKRIFIFSLPLFISGIGGNINEFIDRQLLVYMLPPGEGVSQLGIYSGVMKIASLMYLFLQMYRYAADPFFLSQVKKEDFKKANAEGLKYFAVAAMAIFLVITLYIDIFQYIVSRPEYRVGIPIVPVLLLSYMLFGVYFNMSFWYKVTERTYFAILITFAGVFFTFLLNLLLIPRYGYVGSAYARLGCEAVMVILCYVLNQKYYPVPYDLKAIGRYALTAGVLYGLSVVLRSEYLVVRLAVNTVLLAIFLWFFIQQEKINLRSILNNRKH